MSSIIMSKSVLWALYSEDLRRDVLKNSIIWAEDVGYLVECQPSVQNAKSEPQPHIKYTNQKWCHMPVILDLWMWKKKVILDYIVSLKAAWNPASKSNSEEERCYVLCPCDINTWEGQVEMEALFLLLFSQDASWSHEEAWSQPWPQEPVANSA